MLGVSISLILAVLAFPTRGLRTVRSGSFPPEEVLKHLLIRIGAGDPSNSWSSRNRAVTQFALAASQLPSSFDLGRPTTPPSSPPASRAMTRARADRPVVVRGARPLTT